MSWWRRWDAEVVSVACIIAAIALIASQIGCAEPMAQPHRPASPGVAPHEHPAHWILPAVLCIDSRAVWIGKWHCA